MEKEHVPLFVDIKGSVESESAVRVVYVIPEMRELRRRFRGFVHPAYDGIVFEPIRGCKKISRKSGVIEFEYVHLDRNISNDGALAEISKLRRRPALPEELLAFDAEYPKEKKKFSIIALGAEAIVDGSRRVAYLWHGDGGRDLRLEWPSCGWGKNYRFLVVRK
jgi:hypothetical protein